MKALLEKYAWHIVALILASIAGGVVVFGFGDALGIDPVFREQLIDGLKAAWAFAASLGLVPLLLKELKRDTDGDGTPDILDDDANGNGTPDGQTEPPAAMPSGPTLPLGELGDAL